MGIVLNFGKQKGECSKPIFQILVYYIIKCCTLVFNGFDYKPFLKSNEFSKQVNCFDFKPYVTILNLFFKY